MRCHDHLMQQTQSTRTLSYTDRAPRGVATRTGDTFKIVGAGEQALIPSGGARDAYYLVDTTIWSQRPAAATDEYGAEGDVVQQLMRGISAAGRQLQAPH